MTGKLGCESARAQKEDSHAALFVVGKGLILASGAEKGMDHT